MRKQWTEDIVKEKILKVMSVLNINYMPSLLQIEQLKVAGLGTAIGRTGGSKYWAKKLKLSLKCPMVNRTEEDIKNEILLVVKQLGINRMPSNKEIRKTNGGDSLSNAIARSYGYYEWAKRLNLEVKDSETLMGITYEKICLEALTSKGYKVEDTAVKASYDLIVNDNVKIDVKSGTAYDLRGSRVHTFGINKPLPICDLYIVYALDEERKNIERTFIIPSKNLKLQTLSIGKISKYNKYIDRWDLIDQYDAFYKSVS